MMDCLGWWMGRVVARDVNEHGCFWRLPNLCHQANGLWLAVGDTQATPSLSKTLILLLVNDMILKHFIVQSTGLPVYRRHLERLLFCTECY